MPTRLTSYALHGRGFFAKKPPQMNKKSQPKLLQRPKRNCH